MTSAVDNIALEQEAEALNASLRKLERKGFVKTALQGILWTLSVLLLSGAALTSTLGWWGGPLLRIGGWTLSASALFAAIAVALWRPLRQMRRQDAVLLRIGEAYPHMASDVHSAGQLSRMGGEIPFSTALVTAQIRMIRQFLNAVVPEGRIFPNRRFLPPFAALLFAGAVTAAIWFSAPEIVQSGAAALFSENRPPSKNRRVSEKAPVTADLQVVLKYPAYLRRESRTLENVSGGFVTPLGTTVNLSGRSLVDGAEKGEIRLPDGGRVPLSLSATGAVNGSFVVASGGEYFIALGTDALMVDGPAGTIELEPDAPPVIRLLRPTGRVELRESGGIELELEAEDDHGISRIDMVIRNGGSLEIRKTVVNLTDGIRRFKTKYRWSPDSVRLDEDVDLEIELEAFDDDTILGPKPGRSEPVAVRFLTPQSRHKSALAEQVLTLDGLIDLLAYRLETPVPSAKQPEEALSRYAVARGRTEDLLAKSAKLIGMLNRDSLTPKRVVDTFVQIREDLSNQLLYEGGLYEDHSSADYKSRQGVDKVTCRLLERAIIRVDDLVIEQQMSRVMAAGSELDASRGELLELLTRFRETQSESVRRSLLAAIETMEQKLAQLDKHIEQIRGKVGDVYVNPSAVLRTDLIGSLAELRRLLAGDDLAAAQALVRRMETDLGRLMTGLEGGLLSFRTERFGEGERFIGELLDRVMTLEAGQLQLRRETIALKRAGIERLSDLMRGKIGPLVHKQLSRLDRMRRMKNDLKINGDPDASALDESLSCALRELGLALNQGDLDEARQVAEDVRDIAENAEIGRSAGFTALKDEATRLGDDITAAYPPPAQLLSDKDGRTAAVRAMDQRRILAKARKLKAWIKKQADETRFLSSRAQESLSVASGRMSKSAADLDARRVGEALESQSEALEALADLREDLKRGGELSPLESRPQVPVGRVELPSPDEFEVPKEFRNDILEAMRGDLPNSYEEAIKKYYEALVQ